MMGFKAVVFTIATLATLQLSTAQNTTTCYPGAYVLVARESGAEPGYGYLESVKDEILSRIPNSGSMAVTYPATIREPVVYNISQAEGVGNLTELVRAYGDVCPRNKIILMGYSQGAHVVGDTLIGAYYPVFPQLENKTGIEQRYIDQVAAVIMMGDPANFAGQAFLVGNSTRNGTFPRFNVGNWATANLVDRVQSYCDDNDIFCDQGNSEEVHNGYIPEYGMAAADFAVSQFNDESAASNSTTDANTSTSTLVSTASSTVSTTVTSPSSPLATPNDALIYSRQYLNSAAVGLLQASLTLLFALIF